MKYFNWVWYQIEVRLSLVFMGLLIALIGFFAPSVCINALEKMNR